jgi:hypothetical protein
MMRGYIKKVKRRDKFSIDAVIWAFKCKYGFRKTPKVIKIGDSTANVAACT